MDQLRSLFGKITLNLYLVFLDFVRLLSCLSLNQRLRWQQQEKDFLKIKSSLKDPHFKINESIWFHASSVGELEALTPLIELYSLNGQVSLYLSVFSQSVYKTAIKKFSTLNNLRWVGYAPWGREWKKIFYLIRPKAWVTSKYEAWPEVWYFAYQYDIKVFTIATKKRSSLKWAFFCSIWLFAGGGKNYFSVVNFVDLDELKKYLKAFWDHFQIKLLGDPRWERVHQRFLKHQKTEDLINLKKFAGPNILIVVGSAWLSDLKEFHSIFNDKWKDFKSAIFPHDFSELVAQYEFIKSKSKKVIYYSQLKVLEPASYPDWDVLIVDEFGMLTESYSVADLAIVGGGFGSGVHSTIEPAYFGLPICCGPKGIGRFTEIGQLGATGQLEVISKGDSFDEWLLTNIKDRDQLRCKKEDFFNQNQTYQGGSAGMYEWIECETKKN